MEKVRTRTQGAGSGAGSRGTTARPCSESGQPMPLLRRCGARQQRRQAQARSAQAPVSAGTRRNALRAEWRPSNQLKGRLGLKRFFRYRGVGFKGSELQGSAGCQRRCAWQCSSRDHQNAPVELEQCKMTGGATIWRQPLAGAAANEAWACCVERWGPDLRPAPRALANAGKSGVGTEG